MIDSLYYARGQIWNRKNDRNEEGRAVLKKRRPVIVVSNNVGNFFSGVVTVVPLTTSERLNPLDTQVSFLLNGKQNWALCEQMYCTSKDSLGSYIGTVGTAKMREIDEAIKMSVASDLELEERAAAITEVVSDATVEELADKLNEPAVCVDAESADSEPDSKPKRKRSRYTDERKLELLIAVEDNLKSGITTKNEVANSFGFSNWNSIMATARRFKRELEG